MVITPEEGLHVLERGGTQIVGRADCEPAIRMVRRVEGFGQHPRHQAVGPVLVVLTAFVEHHFTLGVEPGLRQRGQQIAHPIRFHPQGQFERVGGHHFPVVRTIGIRRAVELGAGLLERLEVARIVMFGTFEHQVLEQMREAGSATALVLRPDVIPDVDGCDGARVIIVQQHVEAVGQSVLRVRNVEGRFVHRRILGPVAYTSGFLTTAATTWRRNRGGTIRPSAS